MSIFKGVNFILFVSILSGSTAFMLSDCYFNESQYHVEYICDVRQGIQFSRRNNQYLYCENYKSGIKRGEIQILSFSNCKQNEITSAYFDVFTSLRIINISFTDIEKIYPHDLKYNVHLECIIASHNRLSSLPANLFVQLIDLIELDFSYNRITELSSHMFDYSRKLRKLQFSFNSISELAASIFANMPELEFVDFGNNHIQRIDNDLFAHNKKLKTFRINDNQVKRLECAFLVTLTTTTHSMHLFVNSIETFELSCNTNGKQLDMSIELLSDESKTRLQTTNNGLNWIFNDSDFLKIRHLNLSSGQSSNITPIIQAASTKLETLDLSNNFVGQLNTSTFAKFTNLKTLNLSRTNLTNFQYATFYHQRSLQMLDISYNNLNKIDFYLLLRNFRDLTSLNLEGNNLTEIDTVTRSHFPKLSTLGISKNSFSCEYLVQFLLQWHDLTLLENPSNQTHIAGTDCIHRNSIAPKEMLMMTEESAIFSNLSSQVDDSKHVNNHLEDHLEELQKIKRINECALTVMGFGILAGVFVVLVHFKRNGLMRMCQTKDNMSCELQCEAHNVIYGHQLQACGTSSDDHYVEIAS